MNLQFFYCCWPMLLLGPVVALMPAVAGELEAKPAAAAAAPDEVWLRDGTSYRGTIAESVPGDYLVLVTLTGKTLRFSANEVDYAGPLGKRPVANLAAPGQEGLSARLEVMGKQIPMRFTSPQSDVTLFVHSHTSEGSAWSLEGGAVHAVVNGYSRVCTAPCEARLTEGTYRMGLSQGGSVIETGFLDVREPLELEGKVEDRSSLRTMGWVLFAISALGGSAMMAVSVNEETLEVNDGLLVGGSLLVGGGALLSYFLISASDRAELTKKPAGW